MTPDLAVPPGGRVLIALSGGVDSAVAALRLKEAGYDLKAAYMRTWMNEAGGAVFEDCPWEEDIRQAKAVCEHLGIEFEVVTLIDEYREKVVAYLVEGYRRGITPNPDVMCNREMKFGVFRDYAKAQGFDAVATGHYARKFWDDACHAHILEGVDKNKDQSYFLAMLRQEQIRDALFPIGDLPKPRVREVAREYNLPNANRKDSQGICFLGKVKIGEFLAHYIEDRPGLIVRATDGKELGQHGGLHRFTIGQRKGIGVPSNTDFRNYVVVAKDYEENRLLVAFDDAEAPGLYGSEYLLRDLSWTLEPRSKACDLLARPRHRDPSFPIRFTPLEDGRAHVVFSERQRALASGQVLALYEGERLIGGGIFASSGLDKLPEIQA